MAKPPKQIHREKCIVCQEWSLPKDMYTPLICVFCVGEGRIKPDKTKKV